MKLQNLLKRDNFYAWTILILFIGLVLLTLVHDKMQDQLDISWMYSLNYSVSHNYSFGDQVIFTYGPLSFLGYDIIAGLSTPLIILSVLLKGIYLCYFYFLLVELYNSIKNNESKDLSILVAYILFPWLIFKVATSGDYTLIIFICFIHSAIINMLDLSNLYLAKFFYKRKILLSCFTAFTAAIMFFLKVSFLPFVILVPCVLLITFISKKQWYLLTSFISALLLTFFTVFFFFKIDLHSYLVNSFEIINGYKKTMQIMVPWIDNAKDIRFRIISILLILLFLSQAFYLKKKYVLKVFLVLPIILLAIYFCYVYSFTRGFSGGIIFNIPIVVIIVFFGTYLHNDQQISTRINNIILLILLVCVFNFGYKDFRIFISRPPDFGYVYLDRLPKQLINKTETYDAYPCMSSICYFNNLNYKPRPVIQAYLSYTPKLDAIDADFFSGKKVDNIVFFGSSNNSIDKNVTQHNAIDGRYFVFDEPLAKLAILKNYAIKYRVNDTTFIASKRKQSIQVKLKLVESKVLGFNEEYQLKEDTNKLYFFTTKIKYTSKSKILSLIDRNPYIVVSLSLRSGKNLAFNATPDLLNNPCVLNRYCANYIDFFKLTGSELNELPKVRSIKFSENKAGGFDKQIEFKIYEASF
jgi:hypothetical protein